MIDAIVLAGALNDSQLAICDDVKYEALININDKPILSYVLDALRKYKGIRTIMLVCPKEVMDKISPMPQLVFIESGDTLLESLKNGLAQLDSNRLTLVATGDIPLLTSEAIDDLLKQAKTRDADIYYPVVKKETCEREFPGVKRTYLTLLEGALTGGNVALIKPSAIFALKNLLDKAVITRKKPWKMVGVLGLKLIFKFIIKSLSIPDIENRLKILTGVQAMAIVSDYAEIAFDVDKPEDFELVQEILRCQITPVLPIT